MVKHGGGSLVAQNLQAFVKTAQDEQKNLTFQCNNDPKHKLNSIKECLKKNWEEMHN